jgi:DNA polymerase I
MVLKDYASDVRENLKLCTLEYSNISSGNFREEPVIELFCRDANGNSRQISVHDFYPSFFITEDEFLEQKEDLLNESMVRHIEADKDILSDTDELNRAIQPRDGPPRQTLDNQKLVKIVTVIPGDVSELREVFEETWEADIFFTDRFLIDSEIKVGLSVPQGATDVSFDELEAIPLEEAPNVPPRMLSVDIEVWSGGQFPDPIEAEKPITAITAHDSYTDEYFCSILHPDAVGQGSVHSWPDKIDWTAPDNIDDDSLSVNVYHDERQMLGDFNQFIIDKDFDLVSGWNSSGGTIGNGFDYPYIINRCQRIN